MNLNLEEDILKEFYKNLIDKFGESFLKKALDSGSRNLFEENNDENTVDSTNLIERSRERNIRNYINVLLFGNNLDNNIIKLFDYFETINLEKDFITVNNCIIDNDLIDKKITREIIEVLTKNYEKYYEKNNRSEILLQTSFDKIYKLYVDKTILDLSCEINLFMENIFCDILKLPNIKLYLKGGALLHLLKSSTSELSEKNFNFVDYDFVFNKKLRYSEKNVIETYFTSNKTIKIGRYKFEIKAIKHFVDLSDTNSLFKYTLYTFNLEYQKEKFRIDISDYHGTPDYHINNILMVYKKNSVPEIKLSDSQTIELYNILTNRPNVCPLIKKVMLQMCNVNNRPVVRNNLIGLLLRINKALVKGIKTKGIGKYEGDDSCTVCLTSPSDSDICNSSDNYNLPEQSTESNSTPEIDEESQKYLRSIWIELGCHPTHKICLCCLYNYSKSNLKFTCPSCRSKCIIRKPVDNILDEELDLFDKIWIKSNNSELLNNPSIKYENMLDLRDCKLLNDKSSDTRYLNTINTITNNYGSFESNSEQTQSESESDIHEVQSESASESESVSV